MAERPVSAHRAGFPEREAPGRVALHLLILTAVSLALYANALRGGFVTDDLLQLQSNPLVTSYHYIPRLFATNVWSFVRPTVNNYYRPVQMLVYMGEYYLFGFHPWAFHLVNLLLNVAAVFAAYFLIRALADEKLAIWAALLFAFQPIHVEAVVWIAALPELLCALCYFTAMLFYHRARTGVHPVRNHGMAAAVFFAGLFCKETMLVFPVLLLAYEFFYRRESLRAICVGYRRFLPYLGALGIYIAIRMRVLGSFAPSKAYITHRQIFLTVPILLRQYISKLLWPVNMTYYYGFSPQNTLDWKVIGSVVLIGALVLAMVWMRKSQPLLAFSLAWFFIVIAPVLSFANGSQNMVSNIFAERYLYIPSWGFCVLGGWIWVRVLESTPRKMLLTAAYPTLALVLVFYTVLIVRRVPDWQSNLRMYQKTARQFPNSSAVQLGLGTAYYESRNYDQAVAPLERAIALKPASTAAHLYLAVVLSALGDGQEAVAQLAQADRVRTMDEAPWTLYAQTYANLKQWDRAIEYDRKEIEIEPWSPVVYTALGEALQENGQTDESIATFREALQLEPGYVDASVNLAVTLAEQGNTDEAISLLTTSLQTHRGDPHLDAAWLNLGNVYANKSEWSEAAAAYQHALDLNPDLDVARASLDSVEAQQAARRQ
ncbi:MAG: tetratricopeptide repeat protein [Candidatus Acidiferrales bacterium]